MKKETKTNKKQKVLKAPFEKVVSPSLASLNKERPNIQSSLIYNALLFESDSYESL